jgi:hypothetical protein
MHKKELIEVLQKIKKEYLTKFLDVEKMANAYNLEKKIILELLKLSNKIKE